MVQVYGIPIIGLQTFVELLAVFLVIPYPDHALFMSITATHTKDCVIKLPPSVWSTPGRIPVEKISAGYVTSPSAIVSGVTACCGSPVHATVFTPSVAASGRDSLWRWARRWPLRAAR